MIDGFGINCVVWSDGDNWCWVGCNDDGVLFVVYWDKIDVIDGKVIFVGWGILVYNIDICCGVEFWVLGSGKLCLCVVGCSWLENGFLVGFVDGKL